MTKHVLIWGCYNQGNLGDDLMAAMFFELISELGMRPLILSNNPRLKAMGYETVSSLHGVFVDAVLLGGGAFFKKGGAPDSSIEKAIAELSEFIRERRVPVYGASIGSDGIDDIRNASPARRSVVEGQNFKGACVRLKPDLQIGLPNLTYLPDIVLSTKEACERFPRLSIIDPPADAPEVLINLSRRSAWQIPRALWLAQGKRSAFFRAHTGETKTGGEVALPGFRSVDENNICKALGYIRAASIIISSKLHPGVIGISLGTAFSAVSPQKKTSEFLEDFQAIRMQKCEQEALSSYLNILGRFFNGAPPPEN